MSDSKIPYSTRDGNLVYSSDTGPEGDVVSETKRLFAADTVNACEWSIASHSEDTQIKSSPSSSSSTTPALDSHVMIDDEGKVNFHLDIKGPLPNLLPSVPSSVHENDIDPLGGHDCPPLNIVIFVVGSRGDVQPYIALALQLIIARGHRVRIATHPDFCDLVLSSNRRLTGNTERGQPRSGRLEFFDIGGDPRELMAYMVKNPGLLPGIESLANGDVSSKRKMTRHLLSSCYQSCFSPNARGQPFAADAIISNPPAFAHVHVAEALGLPLILSFTMPWTPTAQFAHPLVNVQTPNAEPGFSNLMSYTLADALMWQGLGDIINSFRVRKLRLPPLSSYTGPLVTNRLKIPYIYAWSESLLPKPKEWKENIDVVGFLQMPRDMNYVPDPALEEFLSAGEPPVYIGFGSIVVQNPNKLTAIILEAVKLVSVRAVVSAGWSDLGGLDLPKDVFLIKGNVSHEWLFSRGRIAAVCHHGGAGTTAAGLSAGLPTVIVPFFGDQPFWGEAVANAGAGPAPIPHKQLTAANLADAIRFALSDSARRSASVIGQRIRAEGREQRGLQSFHRHLPLLNMRCQVDPSRVAVWWSERYCLRLCGPVAAVLVEEGILNWHSLRPHRSKEYDTSRHYHDPFTAGSQAILGVASHSFSSTAQLFYQPHLSFLNIVWGIPKASLDVIGSVQEGIENIPGIMGTRVRTRGKVVSTSTGFKEGGKLFAYGIMDGITGLVTDPYDGAKAEGVAGFFKGTGKGILNLAARPAAGALGLFVHPTAGAYRGTRARLAHLGLKGPDANDNIRKPRQQESVNAARGLGVKERMTLLATFRSLSSSESIKARRRSEQRRLRDVETALLSLHKADKGKGRSDMGFGPSTLDTIESSAPVSMNSQRSDSRGGNTLASVFSRSEAGPSRQAMETTGPPPVPEKDSRWRLTSESCCPTPTVVGNQPQPSSRPPSIAPPSYHDVTRGSGMRLQ